MQQRLHRYRAGLRLLSLSLVIGALAAFTGHATPDSRAHAGGTHGAGFVVPSNCVSCSTCGLSTIRHVASYDVNGDFKNAHSDCLDFPGCSGHPACGSASAPDEVAFEAVLARAFHRDSAAVRELFIQFPSRVRFNAPRMAIQVIGCQPGAILAHLPLSAPQLATIADLPEVRQELASR